MTPEKPDPLFENKVSAILALGVVSMIPVALVLLLFKDVPPTTRDIVMVLVGAIVANATQAVQYKFGSNPSSSKKDETIHTLASTAQTAQAALAPVPGGGETIPVAPGETKTVVGTGEVNE